MENTERCARVLAYSDVLEIISAVLGSNLGDDKLSEVPFFIQF